MWSLLGCLCLIAVASAFKFPLKRQTFNHDSHSRHARDVANLPLSKKDIGFYTLNVSFGTPQQTFALALDTGSIRFWVACNCSSFCENRATFDFKKSSTFVGTYTNPTDIAFPREHYLDGTNMAGFFFEDVVCTGSFCEKQDGMICADSFSSDRPVRNLLPGISGIYPLCIWNKLFPPTKSILNSKNCTRKIASLYLGDAYSDDSGLLSFCEIDHQHHSGEILWVKSLSAEHWVTYVDYIADNATALNVSTVYDSGTTSMTVPEQFYKQAFGEKGLPEEINCTELHAFKTIELRISGRTFKFRPEDYYVRSFSIKPGFCYKQIDYFGSAVILGMPFLQKVFTVYDFETESIGFDLSKKANEIS